MKVRMPVTVNVSFQPQSSGAAAARRWRVPTWTGTVLPTPR